MHSDLPGRCGRGGCWLLRTRALRLRARSRVARTPGTRTCSRATCTLSGCERALGSRAGSWAMRTLPGRERALSGHVHTLGMRACAPSRDTRRLLGHLPGDCGGRPPLRDTPVLPRDVGHEGLQLPRLVGAREGPAHVAGSVPDVGAHAAGSPPLLVGQCPQDHGDNWAEGAKAVSTGPRGQHLLSRRDCRQRSSDRSGHDRHARSSPSRQNSPAAQVR